MNPSEQFGNSDSRWADLPLRIEVSAPRLEARELVDVAKAVESVGLPRLWVPDHVVNPVTFESRYPYTSTGARRYPTSAPLADPLITISNLLASTTSLSFGVGVFVLALRNPTLTGAALATLDNLAPGRVTIGVGAGWLAEEFDLVGSHFDKRGEITDAHLKSLVDFLRHGRLTGKAAVEVPYGHQGDMALFIGGLSRAAYRRCAEVGDGWYGPRCGLDQAVETRREIRRALQDRGRSDENFVFLPRVVDPPTLRELTRFADAGFSACVVPLSAELGRLIGWESVLETIGA